MSRSSVPGPVARFVRDGTGALTAGLLGGALLLSGGLTNQADLVLGRVLDENWRGAYDLLVTSPNADLGHCLDDQSVLVAPNFAGQTSAAALSMSDLETIRGTAGVDVAAPIGLVGSLPSMERGLTITAPYGDPETSPGYRITSRVTLDDGVEPRSLSDHQFDYRFETGNEGVRAVTSDGQPSSVGEESADMVVGVLPLAAASIVAIDPDAEKKLLGQTGAFLDPLEHVNQYGTDDYPSLVADEVFQHFLEADPDLSLYPTVMGPVTEEEFADTRFAPLLVNNDPDVSVHLDLSARPVDDSRPSQDSGPPVTDTHDLRSAFVPFTGPVLNFPQPGTEVDISYANFFPSPELFAPFYAAPPSFAPIGDQTCELRAAAHGRVDAAGEPIPTDRSDSGYSEQTYRAQVAIDQPPTVNGRSVLPVPVGRYDADSLTPLTQSLPFVPLGAYERAPITLHGDDPQSVQSGELLPGLSGRGLLAPTAGALTTLEGGQQLRGGSFIDAVRVRVADVDRYDETGRQTVAQVAGRLTDAGFTVTVVAGASQQSVPIYVPDYDLVDGEATDLGWVRQDWTALDAASRVESSVDSAGLLLVLFTLGSGLLLSLLTALREAHFRRADLRLLQELGWTRRRRLTWLALPTLLGTGLVAACATAVAVYLQYTGAHPSVPWFVYGVVPLAFALIGLLALASADRPSPPRRPRIRAQGYRPTAGPTGFGLERALRGISDSFTVMISMVVASLGVGLSVMTVVNLISHAGSSRLAEAAVTSSRPLHLALVGVVVLVTVLFIGLVRRAGIVPARAMRQQLVSLGWGRTDITRWSLGETAPPTVLATLTAGAAGWTVAERTGTSALLLVSVCVLTVLIAGLILGAARTRGTGSAPSAVRPRSAA